MNFEFKFVLETTLLTFIKKTQFCMSVLFRYTGLIIGNNIEHLVFSRTTNETRSPFV